MRRHQPEHAIRTACQIIPHTEVIVVGSQAILRTCDESQIPTAATMSIEVDIRPIADTNVETARLADLIEGVAGEFSSFEELHGFSIDGVDLDTAVLPEGWRDRLVKVQNANTAAPAGSPRFTEWCLDKEDLCVAKLIAFREMDLNFVGALLDDRLVDLDEVRGRLGTVANSATQPASRAIHGSGAATQADPARSRRHSSDVRTVACSRPGELPVSDHWKTHAPTGCRCALGVAGLPDDRHRVVAGTYLIHIEQAGPLWPPGTVDDYL